MRYDDDQCEQCGGIRVTKSTLCVSCLVRRLDAEMKELLINHRIIEKLEKIIGQQTGQLNDALHYGFKQNQENAKLQREIKGLQLKIR